MTESLFSATGAWLFSRSVGLTAYLALTIEIITGLALSTGIFDRLMAKAKLVDAHKSMSLFVLFLISGHAFALLFDNHVPFRWFELILPFVSHYHPVLVGIGSLSFWALFLVHITFFFRTTLGPKTWRVIHAFSPIAYVAATIHGIAIGTDSTSSAQWLYTGSISAVVFLLVNKYFLATAKKNSAADLS